MSDQLDRAALVAAVDGLRNPYDHALRVGYEGCRDAVIDLLNTLPAAPTIDRAALEAAGFEPDFNVCASCKHGGGKHDLRNVCLICGDRFAEMSTDEKWAHGVALLHRGETP